MNINPSFISSCRSPRVIKTMRGEQQLCSCGKCSDCQNKKSVYYTDMISRASSQFKYCYFFTLTYNEFSVPRVLLLKEGYFNGISDADLGYTPFTSTTQDVHDSCDKLVARYITCRKLKTKFKYSPEYGSVAFKIPFKNFNNENFQQFYKKSKVYSKYFTQSQIDYYNSNYVLRVLRKKDVQNFLKILRFNISTCPYLDNNPSISYFFAGEYGPTTFRPHYHGLLFFDDEQLLSCIKELLISSWRFGKVEEPGLARSSGKCCSYVASYCNSFAYLPDYLSFKSIRPFQLHSIGLGNKTLSSLRKNVYENPKNFFQTTDTIIDGAPFTFTPTNQVLNSLFPRCYNYSNQLSHNRTFLYEAYSKLVEQFHSTKPSDLTRYVLVNSDIYLCKRFLSLLDILPFGKPPIELSLISPLVSSFDVSFNDFSEYMMSIYNRVYSAITLSKQFIEIAKDYFSSPREFLNIIDNYYNGRSLYLLKFQYETIIEYYKYHATPLTYWDILHNTRKHPITDYKHHLYYSDIFYFNSPNYHKSLSKCSLVQNNFAYKDSYYRKKVKHKELNDANLIFVNVLND